MAVKCNERTEKDSAFTWWRSARPDEVGGGRMVKSFYAKAPAALLSHRCWQLGRRTQPPIPPAAAAARPGRIAQLPLHDL